MQIFAVDLETTGLNPKIHSIVEVAIISWNLNETQAVERFHRYITPEDMVWSKYCLHLHSKMIEAIKTIPKNCEVAFDKPKQIPATQLVSEIKAWLLSIGLIDRMTACGKNFSSFDKPFFEALPNYTPLFKHRSLDPTVAYIEPVDAVPPDLKLCKFRAKKLGACFSSVETAHTAMEDCEDIKELMQFAYSNRGWLKNGIQ